jgi:hypothetical protein
MESAIKPYRQAPESPISLIERAPAGIAAYLPAAKLIKKLNKLNV